tara:strand:- start:233 stop:472 length:240 start_codon:yes stop_codon:yes gene_type:complete
MRDIQIDNLIKSRLLDRCLCDVQSVLRQLEHLVGHEYTKKQLYDEIDGQIYPMQRATENLKSIIKALKNQMPLKEEVDG